MKIYEINANPKGKDSGLEWIIIKNNSDQENFENLTIISSNKNGNQKKHWEEQDFFLKKGNLKKISVENLPNSSTEIKFIVNKKIAQIINYESAPEGKIYKLSSIIDSKNNSKDSWNWLSEGEIAENFEEKIINIDTIQNLITSEKNAYKSNPVLQLILKNSEKIKIVKKQSNEEIIKIDVLETKIPNIVKQNNNLAFNSLFILIILALITAAIKKIYSSQNVKGSSFTS